MNTYRHFLHIGWAFAVSTLVGCSSSRPADDDKNASGEPDTNTGAGSEGDGAGFGFGSGASSSGAAGGDYCGTSLVGTVRDFQEDHPDFEYIEEVDPGIVVVDLGADGKPAYAGPAGNPTTTGQMAFDQWYRDVEGVNLPIPLTVTLSPSGGDVYTYHDPNFFPIDGEGFGDEGQPHNYHFTFELHTKFIYQGGEVFRFAGDDDLFTYINGKLAIDLGGVHPPLSQQVDLDAKADQLGIKPGNVYSLDFFFAERHTSQSNFRIDTTIASFVDCGSAPPK